MKFNWLNNVWREFAGSFRGYFSPKNTDSKCSQNEGKSDTKHDASDCLIISTDYVIENEDVTLNKTSENRQVNLQEKTRECEGKFNEKIADKNLEEIGIKNGVVLAPRICSMLVAFKTPFYECPN